LPTRQDGIENRDEVYYFGSQIHWVDCKQPLLLKDLRWKNTNPNKRSSFDNCATHGLGLCHWSLFMHSSLGIFLAKERLLTIYSFGRLVIYHI